jgi:anti-sigma B factor antagonist
MTSPSKEFALSTASGVPVITAPAAIDLTNADDLRVALLAATTQGFGTVIVDLRGTEFCDSAAVRELARGHDRAVAEGGQLRLVVPEGRLPLLLDVVGGLRRAPSVYPTLEAAQGEWPRSHTTRRSSDALEIRER